MSDDAARQYDSEARLTPTDIEHFKERLEAEHDALQQRITALRQSSATTRSRARRRLIQTTVIGGNGKSANKRGMTWRKRRRIKLREVG
jgi:hypothetical protein